MSDTELSAFSRAVKVFDTASPSAGGSRQSVVVGMAYHEYIGYGLDSALTCLLQGFVAEGVSVQDNPTFQLTSDG
ncbi:MAG: hypothetical protein CMK65_02150 [Pseudoalteromonas sp.]|nr:hypothetical protein [Pseudoalteromonas sp.]